jgi:hypothetical protein
VRNSQFEVRSATGEVMNALGEMVNAAREVSKSKLEMMQKGFEGVNMRFGRFLYGECLGKGDFISSRKDNISYSKRKKNCSTGMFEEDLVVLRGEEGKSIDYL